MARLSPLAAAAQKCEPSCVLWEHDEDTLDRSGAQQPPHSPSFDPYRSQINQSTSIHDHSLAASREIDVAAAA